MVRTRAIEASVRLTLTLAVLLLLVPQPIEPCSESNVFEALHWYDALPSWGDASFVSGELGILGPDLRASRLWIAYRYLDGLSLANEEQSRVLGLLDPAPRQGPRVWPVPTWLEARRRVPGAPPVEAIYTWRELTFVKDGYVWESVALNCPDDAFEVATATLQSRIEEFGLASAEVGEWLRGQDAVFANCSEGFELPPTLDSSWSGILRRDRAYQRAAALFYAARFEEAERAFREIATDGSSQWAATARYLVARAKARAGNMAEAVAWLEQIAADPEAGVWRERARKLADHYTFRIDPASRTAEACVALNGDSLPGDFAQDVTDWIMGLDTVRGRAGALGMCPMSDWFMVWRRWRGPGGELPALPPPTTGTPWLVAALATATVGAADVDRLLDLALDVSPENPGFLTARFHRARLLIQTGRHSTARTELTALLDSVSLSDSDRNRLRDLRALTATGAKEFLHDAVLQPVVVGNRGAGGPLHPVGASEFWKRGERLPTMTAIDLFNRMSPERLLEIESEHELPFGLRRRIVLLAWTRAVVLDRYDAVRAAAARAAALDLPETDALQVSTSDEAARFEAALVLLRNPNWTPYLIDPVGPQFKADGPYYVYSVGTLRTAANTTIVLVPTQRVAESLADRGTVQDLHRRLDHGWEVGPMIISYSELHPDDPRVPEALHLVVRATRYPRWNQGSTGEVSRSAFRVLHRRYPDSPWTEKTPYWFGS